LHALEGHNSTQVRKGPYRCACAISVEKQNVNSVSFLRKIAATSEGEVLQELVIYSTTTPSCQVASFSVIIYSSHPLLRVVTLLHPSYHVAAHKLITAGLNAVDSKRNIKHTKSLKFAAKQRNSKPPEEKKNRKTHLTEHESQF